MRLRQAGVLRQEAAPEQRLCRRGSAAHLLADLLAEVLVVALQELALNVKVQRLLQAALAPHIQRHLVELFLLLAAVGDALADDLRGQAG